MTTPATIPTVQDMALEHLREWPRNPRRISKPRLEQLKRALVAEPEMLQARPLIALPDGTVVAGNQRLRAARELGWSSLPVVVVDLDEARASEWALRDNRGYGEDDEALVGALLAELAASGRDLDLSGYDSGEVDRLLAAVRPEPVVDPDDAPPLPVEPRSVRGEVYELGPHRVMCGDATSEADVGALVGSGRGSLLFTSPPYLDARDYGGDKLDVEHLASFLALFAELADLQAVNLGIIRRANAVVPYWNAYLEAASAAGLVLLSWNVWDRAQPWSIAQNTAMFPLEHEWVFVFGSERVDLALTVENKTPGTRTGITNRQRNGTLKAAAPKHVREHRALGTVFRSPPHIGRDSGHPAMFPVALPSAYIEAATTVGDHVIDPFAGSGTTLIACDQLGRRALCMEIDPAYVDVIRQRYADFTGQPDLAP